MEDSLEKYSVLWKIPGVKVLKMEPLSRHSYFRIGGPADVLCIPGSEEAIEELLKAISSRELPWKTIGLGTNVLFSDEGMRGIVIKLSKGFERIQSTGRIIEAQASAKLLSVSKFARDESLQGLEFVTGIPGSIGGAVFTNAGAYGGEVGKLIRWVKGYTKTGRVCLLDGASIDFGYRKAVLPYPVVLTSVTLELHEGDRSEIKAKMESFEAKRKQTQPIKLPSAGSVFRNPQGNSAGKLIEQCGLKGRIEGGAQISELHGNFIVNIGSAKASDVRRLVDIARNEVLKRFGIELELEIEMVPEIV
ncbi:MAG: UDP-N-acetylmuramate dehydrogenase [Candidatus Eisenbacteria bacterium]|nr:UDP-N-acetylmuramate dehydrogenase [Candidatus Eisenbacteria bacterium]